MSPDPRYLTCLRLASQNNIDGDELETAALAIWSNLGPQMYTFDRALSLALSALCAIRRSKS